MVFTATPVHQREYPCLNGPYATFVELPRLVYTPPPLDPMSCARANLAPPPPLARAEVSDQPYRSLAITFRSLSVHECAVDMLNVGRRYVLQLAGHARRLALALQFS
jgi:hypothetical protein